MDNWITNLHNKNIRICSLKLPGTHHSAVNQLINTNLNIIKNLTITQNDGIYNQLMKGIRFLDLRITYNNKENEIYIAHTFTSKTLNSVFNDILLFNESHPYEPIVIKICVDNRNKKHYNKYSKNANLKLNEINKRIEGISSKFKTTLKIKDIQNTRRPIIHLNGIIEIPYINTTNPRQKYDNIIEYMYPKSGIFSLVDIALTPSIYSVFLNLSCCGNIETLRFLASISQNYFLSNTKKEDWKNLNCITTDYPTDEWIQYIVDLN
jgi:hypothetical protein